jgi:hypothetical protein
MRTSKTVAGLLSVAPGSSKGPHEDKCHEPAHGTGPRANEPSPAARAGRARGWRAGGSDYRSAGPIDTHVAAGRVTYDPPGGVRRSHSPSTGSSQDKSACQALGGPQAGRPAEAAWRDTSRSSPGISLPTCRARWGVAMAVCW